MRRIASLSFLVASLGLFACSPITAPDNGGGGGIEEDGGISEIDAGEQFDCDPGCGANATCQSDFTCECNDGFEGDGLDCGDIDECANDNGGCDPNATCENFEGGFACSCPPEFVGDGFTCTQIWERIGVLDGVNIDPVGFGAVATVSGNFILFGPRGADAATAFMRRFNIENQIFSDPLSMPGEGTPDIVGDFCACGLTSSFIGTGPFAYLLGNDGKRYNIATDNWRDVQQYQDQFDLRRGESAAALVEGDNAIHLVGGRQDSITGTRVGLALNQEQVDPLETQLPFEMDHAVGFSPPGTREMFIAGGDTNNGRSLLRTDGSGSWEELADAPEDLGRASAMGEFEGFLWVAKRDGEFRIYDAANDNWLPFSLFSPPGFVSAVWGPAGTFVLTQSGSAMEIHQLRNLPPMP